MRKELTNAQSYSVKMWDRFLLQITLQGCFIHPSFAAQRECRKRCIPGCVVSFYADDGWIVYVSLEKYTGSKDGTPKCSCDHQPPKPAAEIRYSETTWNATSNVEKLPFNNCSIAMHQVMRAVHQRPWLKSQELFVRLHCLIYFTYWVAAQVICFHLYALKTEDFFGNLWLFYEAHQSMKSTK